METRLLRAGLWRRRGTASLAVLAIAIGGSVASALLHVSGDISRKVSHELRALGPNLLLVPDQPAASLSGPGRVEELPAPAAFLDERESRARLSSSGLAAAPLLYMVARVGGQPVQLIGTDLDLALRLHPGWKLSRGQAGSLMGVRLMRRLGARPGQKLRIEYPGNGRSLERVVEATLEAGGADDEAWWLPLREVQELGDLAGRVSLFQARIEGGGEEAERLRRSLERGGGLRALPVAALSATEAGLLDRMRRLMLLVTLAALASAGLCTFGSLTDLALERRRDIALMKTLGAGRRDVMRQLAGEALVIGLAGGLLGWGLGLFMAELIGRGVFHSAIAMRWDVPPIVIGLSLAVALVGSVGPVRLALSVEPAAVLKGE